MIWKGAEEIVSTLWQFAFKKELVKAADKAGCLTFNREQLKLVPNDKVNIRKLDGLIEGYQILRNLPSI